MTEMTRNKFPVFTWISLGVATIIFGAVFFFLGPTLYFGHNEKVLDSLVLDDGSSLILAQKSNRLLSEPFTVRVYRLYPNHKAYKTLVGFEESYWWLGRLRPVDKHSVNIKWFGNSACSYDTESCAVTWNDKSYPPQQADTINYDMLLEQLKRGGFRYASHTNKL